jgi:hypothetical protein
MPSNPWVWVCLIVAIGVVVSLALWLGRGFKARFGNRSVEVEAQQRPSTVSVARGTEFENVKAGDIVGRKVELGANSSADNVSVLEQAKLKQSEIGDIIGEELSSGPRRGPGKGKSDADRT